jgi:hypothetical protein
MKVQFPKLKFEKDGNRCVLEKEDSEIKIEEGCILKHNFKTIPGDSGTPIITQSDAIEMCTMIIAIHASVKLDKKNKVVGRKSIKITKEGMPLISKMAK